MRMARIQVSKRRRLSPSALLEEAIVAEIERREKLAELDRYLAELGPRVGEAPAADRARGEAVATRVKAHFDRSRLRRAG